MKTNKSEKKHSKKQKQQKQQKQQNNKNKNTVTQHALQPTRTPASSPPAQRMQGRPCGYQWCDRRDVGGSGGFAPLDLAVGCRDSPRHGLPSFLSLPSLVDQPDASAHPHTTNIAGCAAEGVGVEPDQGYTAAGSGIWGLGATRRFYRRSPAQTHTSPPYLCCSAIFASGRHRNGSADGWVHQITVRAGLSF